ncbi:MAG: hypothetical protein AAF480_00945 [Actinomycetota bacterium]
MDTFLSTIRSRRGVVVVGLLGLLALVATACGGEDEAAASSNDGGIATLAEPADDVGSDEAPVDAELAADEAALEFSQCMRDQGLDFPDIGVDAEGNPDLRSSFVDSGITPGSEEFRTGLEACGSILQTAGFGGGRGNAADDPAVQDGLVEYSQCLRDEGLAVGDIQLGGQGQGGDGQRQGQGGGVDRGGRIAAFLGIDPDDPEVAAALETCGPILDRLFTQVAGGAGG